jgi:predicted aldo/keto reductase-like oxidoreductase
LNYAGLFNEEVEGTLKLLREMKAVVIAKKVLGAGRLPVGEALRWAFSRPEVDSVALGVASLSEAKETLELARRLATRRTGAS